MAAMSASHHAFNRMAMRSLAGVLVLVSFGAGLKLGTAASRERVLFYNPESNINNFSTLKTEFDTYLASVGNYEFQPFSSSETFEQFLSREEGSIFLLSSWHFQYLRGKYRIKPVLVGSVGGKTTQKKGLYARKETTDAGALNGQKIASAGSREFTQNILREILQQQGRAGLAETVRIIPVPKDMDALMAVALGLASAALTAESSIDQLRTLNPKHCESLHRLGLSDELPRTIVAVRDPSPDSVVPLVQALEQMPTQPKGEYAMQMIGLDGWQRYDAAAPGRLGQR